MKKVLIVDDEEDMKPLILQKFRKETKQKAITFDFARDGQEAYDKVCQGDRFDIILTDINMPNMNGVDFLKSLRKIHPDLPVYVTSAYTDQENLNRIKENGASGFIAKPMDLDLLKKFLHGDVTNAFVL